MFDYLPNYLNYERKKRLKKQLIVYIYSLTHFCNLIVPLF